MRNCCSSPGFVCAPIFRASQTFWKIETGAVQSHETAQGAPASSSTAIPLHSSWVYSKLLQRNSAAHLIPLLPSWLDTRPTTRNFPWFCRIQNGTFTFWPQPPGISGFLSLFPCPNPCPTSLTCATREGYTSPASLCSKLSHLIHLSSQPHQAPNSHIHALLLECSIHACSGHAIPKLHLQICKCSWIFASVSPTANCQVRTNCPYPLLTTGFPTAFPREYHLQYFLYQAKTPHTWI